MNLAEARKILGVANDASNDDIKKAYRRAAKKFHPDKKGGSQEKFVQAKEAYDTLTNPPKPKFSQSYNQPDLSEMFSRAFGFNPFNLNPQLNIVITPQEAFAGCTRHVEVQIPTTQKIKSVTINIHAGVRDGQVVDTIKEDNFTANFVVRVASDDRFQIDWSSHGNVISQMSMSALKMIKGGSQEITTLDGKKVIAHIPSGMAAGSFLKIGGKGYWTDETCTHRGDLLVRILPDIVPLSKLDSVEAKEFAKAILSQFPDEVQPHIDVTV